MSKINKIIAGTPPIASPVTMVMGIAFDTEQSTGQTQNKIDISNK